MNPDPASEEYEIGGGIEYNNDVTRSDATTVVSSVSGLKSALSNASSGDVVWIDNDAVLNMDGEYNIGIPVGVTLASGRGIDGQRGALLHVDQERYYDNALFKSAAKDVRVTGLQLQGPNPYYYCPNGLEPSTDEQTFDEYLATGIWLYSSEKAKDVEVDNCHLWDWTRAAVLIGSNNNATGSRVHHCSFHDNAMEHYGYGVNLFNGESLIDNCYFGLHRHCIAGFGNPENSYEARDNIVAGYETVSHAFNMHNWASNGGDYEVAGDTINIHHNTFEYEQEVDDDAECDYFTRNGSSQEYIKIRGEPENRCDMDNNWFKRRPKPPYDSTGGSQYAYTQDDVDSWLSMYESNNVFDTLSEPSSDIGHSRPKTAIDIHSGTAVDVTGDGTSSGVQFQLNNNASDQSTIFTVTVSPYKDQHNYLRLNPARDSGTARFTSTRTIRPVLVISTKERRYRRKSTCWMIMITAVTGGRLCRRVRRRTSTYTDSITKAAVVTPLATWQAKNWPSRSGITTTS